MTRIDSYFDQSGFQNIIRCGTINYFDGWVFNHDRSDPVGEVIFKIGDEVLGSLLVRKERPDLAKMYDQSLLGFNGVVDIPERYFGHILCAYARSRKGTQVLLKEFLLNQQLSEEEKRFRKENLMPNDLLMHLVVHNVNPQTFLEEGKKGVETIVQILAEQKIILENIRSILDFGVGCGRVLRWWSEYSSKIEFYGTDINSLLIDWCRANLSFAKYAVNDLHPPVEFRDGQFDFLYAFSVFTHLRIETQMEWLAEFHRILSPQKYLLISVHGDYHAKMLAPEVVAEYKKNGYYVLSQNAEGENLCATYQSKVFSEGYFSKYFSIIGYYPQTLNACGNQDLYLLQRKDTTFSQLS